MSVCTCACVSVYRSTTNRTLTMDDRHWDQQSSVAGLQNIPAASQQSQRPLMSGWVVSQLRIKSNSLEWTTIYGAFQGINSARVDEHSCGERPISESLPLFVEYGRTKFDCAFASQSAISNRANTNASESDWIRWTNHQRCIPFPYKCTERCPSNGFFFLKQALG